MNYGPLSGAIEQLVKIVMLRPPKSHKEEQREYNAQINRCWEDIQKAQGDFYDRVLDGSLKRDDF